MTDLAKDQAFRRAVSDEVWRQFAKSVRTKVVLLAVAVAAIAIVVGLDVLKTELRNTRERSYKASVVARQLSTSKELAPLAAKLDKSARYATADDVFNKLLLDAGYAAALAEKQQEIRDTYVVEIAGTDSLIRAQVKAPRPEGEEAAKKAKDQLTELKARRAELVAARTAELTEAAQATEVRAAALRRAFDHSRVAETAESKFEVISNRRLNTFVQRVLDSDHPLSIIYDVLWYASLVIGVLALIALILTPIFRTLPVTGADDKFMDQIRGIFGRAPGAIGAGMARVAAMTIGTAAIVSVATTAPSSPLYESAMMPPRIEQEVAQTTTVTTTEGPNKGPTKDTPSDPAPADPRIEALIGDVDQLKNDNTAHKTAFDTHKRILEKLEPIPAEVATLASEENAQKNELTTKFTDVETGVRNARDTADKADLKADFAQQKADIAERTARGVGEQLTAGVERIDERASGIEDGVDLAYKIGERPGVLQSFLGFDRYRITGAVVTYLRRAGAPAEVIETVAAMQSDTVMSNDGLRLDLRRRLCGGNVNCETYLAWRATVIRAARLQ